MDYVDIYGAKIVIGTIRFYLKLPFSECTCMLTLNKYETNDTSYV